jgi:hypothetical protein
MTAGTTMISATKTQSGSEGQDQLSAEFRI